MGMFKKLLCKMGIGNCEEHSKDDSMEEGSISEVSMQESEMKKGEGVVGNNAEEGPFSEKENPEQ